MGRLAGEQNPYSNLDSTLDTIQGGLNLAGMIPGVGAIPDLINAGTYAARGKWGDAALSAVSAIPFVGSWLGGARAAKSTSDVFRGIEEAGKTMRF